MIQRSVRVLPRRFATLLGFAVRRLGLQTGGDDYLSHLLLFAILITGFMIEGARMAVTELHQNPGLARFSYGGLPMAWLLEGWPPGQVRALHNGLWWLHLGLAMLSRSLLLRRRRRPHLGWGAHWHPHL